MPLLNLHFLKIKHSPTYDFKLEYVSVYASFFVAKQRGNRAMAGDCL